MCILINEQKKKTEDQHSIQKKEMKRLIKFSRLETQV